MTPLEHETKTGLSNPFLDWNLEQWQEACPAIQQIEVADKHYLYRQGDSCAGFFWVKEGIIKLSHITLQGNEVTLALLQPGDIIGCLQRDAINQTMKENAQSLGKSRFYRIGHDDFKELMSRWPDWSWSVFEAIYNRQQQIERKLRTILTQPVEKRVIVTLLELAQLFGTRCTHGYALEIFLTQQELADLVGASRSVVSTIMNDFRNKGMLDYTREQICVNDTALINAQSFV